MIIIILKEKCLYIRGNIKVRKIDEFFPKPKDRYLYIDKPKVIGNTIRFFY